VRAASALVDAPVEQWEEVGAESAGRRGATGCPMAWAAAAAAPGLARAEAATVGRVAVGSPAILPSDAAIVSTAAKPSINANRPAGFVRMLPIGRATASTG